LVYSVNRYYDPATAIFVTVDPSVAGTTQPYGYVDGDPVNNYDPLGLCRIRAWVQVDPSGRCVPGYVYTRARHAIGSTLRAILIKWDHLAPDEVTLIGSYENKAWDPSAGTKAGVWGLGQIEYKSRLYITEGLNHSNGKRIGPAPRVGDRRIDPNTTDPFLQIWLMRRYLRDCGLTAARAVAMEPQGGYGC
jgi:uncharacterized protein RhaS with RHS repeats